MRERKSDKQTPTPWQVPVVVEDIGDDGQHFDLVADKDVRAAVARVANVRDLPRFEATFDVTRHESGALHVLGRISATVGQDCVVTLEPLASEVEEDIDVLFAAALPPVADEADEDEEKPAARSGRKWNEPEPLIGGMVDLGALATEFLILGIDPYPRKPGAVFEAPQDVKPEASPFAALANLAKGRDGK
jgi:hypothetical protein